MCAFILSKLVNYGNVISSPCLRVFQFLKGDTLDYLGIQGLHLAGSQGVVVIAICQALLMVMLVLVVSTIY